jgi:hypothetical protein
MLLVRTNCGENLRVRTAPTVAIQSGAAARRTTPLTRTSIDDLEGRALESSFIAALDFRLS